MRSPGNPSSAAGQDNAQQWLIQAASFRDRARAEVLLHRLAEEGIQAFIAQGSVSGHEVFRVRAGPFSGAQARDRMANRLRTLLEHDVLVLKK